jgi:hypothetical protein
MLVYLSIDNASFTNPFDPICVLIAIPILFYDTKYTFTIHYSSTFHVTLGCFISQLIIRTCTTNSRKYHVVSLYYVGDYKINNLVVFNGQIHTKIAIIFTTIFACLCNNPMWYRCSLKLILLLECFDTKAISCIVVNP